VKRILFADDGASVGALRDLVQNDTIRAVVARVDRLPSPPMTYLCLNEAVANPNNGWAAIAAIVEEDPVMCAQILRLVNSGYFGLAHRTTSVVQAVSNLGMGVLRGLALNAHVLGAVEGTTVNRGVVDAVQRNALATAAIAKQKVRDREAADDAFTAGIVHDIGKIVLALTMPQPWRDALSAAVESGRPLHAVEKEVLGVSHAEVGAYLLGVWGLPFRIVEATAFHHHPSAAGDSPSQVLGAVHLADALVSEQCGGPGTLDLDFVERVGLTRELESWRAAAARYVGRGAPSAMAVG
jgi:HD-like signal output (HDOD) protein